MSLKMVVLALMSGLAALGAESAMDLYQKALTQERAVGNLEEAINLYQRVAKEFASDRGLAAKALLQAARCYEKLGQDQAVKLYEQVTRDFSDQRESAAIARTKLAALRQLAPDTMTQRRIDVDPNLLSPDGSSGDRSSVTDGERVIAVDTAAGGLISRDLAGGTKHLIFKAGPGEVDRIFPSKDLSMVLIVFKAEPNQPARLAVIKTDGTGYHEIARLDFPRGISTCRSSWSWDSRHILTCDFQPDGTRRLLSISVDNGDIRELFRGEPTVNPNPAFSPDGRFVAYSDGRVYEGLGKVFVLPADGGSPKLVFENGTLLDWSRDGRFLIINSRRSGADALYLLPVKDGQAAGDPVLVRYGSFINGHTTSRGALIYSAVPPDGNWRTSIASIDANGHVGEWRVLNLHIGGSGGPGASWSPDGSQIAYTATRDDAGQPGSVVLVRNLSTGAEREVHRDTSQVFCVWVPQAKLICQRYPDGWRTTEMFSINVNSGQVEKLAVLPGLMAGIHALRDGRSLYMFADISSDAPKPSWYRWEIGAKQASKMEDQWIFPTMRPADEWLSRITKGRELEIRPISGGDWRRLVSLNADPAKSRFPIAYTPDGQWILYADANSTGRDSLFRVSPAGGEPQRVGDYPPAYHREGNLALSPDGRQILAESTGAAPSEIWLLENFVPKPPRAH